MTCSTRSSTPGHAPQLEAPAGFNAAVLRFLAGGYPFERLTKKR